MTGEARLRAGAVAALIAFTAFIGVAASAHAAHSGTMVDHRLLAWLVAHRKGWLTDIAVGITDAGSPAVVFLIAAAAVVLLWRWTHTVMVPAITVGTLAVASGMGAVAKVVVGSHRPPSAVQLLTETDHSFPSGHVTGTLALLGILAVVVGRRTRCTGRLLTIAAAATLLVAASRLYLGVHWLSDVIGGMLLGTTSVVVGSMALIWLARDELSPRTGPRVNASHMGYYGTAGPPTVPGQGRYRR